MNFYSFIWNLKYNAIDAIVFDFSFLYSFLIWSMLND